MQTVHTQIRLLLKEQSDQGLHCRHSNKYFTKQLYKKQNLGQTRTGVVFEILGHLLFFLLKFEEKYGNNSLAPI